MKLLNLKHKLIKRILSKRGESIMEAVVALVILGILMTTILTIIRFSLAMTGGTIRNATDTQDDFNSLIHEVYITPSTSNITFSFEIPASEGPIIGTVVHAVDVSNLQDAVAFRPASGGGG